MQGIKESIEEVRSQLEMLIIADSDFDKICEISQKLDVLVLKYYKDKIRSQN